MSFSGFLARNLSVFFGPRFSALKRKSSKNLVKKKGFLMSRPVEICRKTWFFDVKMWSKLASKKHTFFEAIFRNRHPVSTGALFLEVPGTKNIRKTVIFCSIFYV